MGFWKRLFGSKEPIKEEPESVPSGKRFIEDMCVICNGQIAQERWKKIGNDFVHKKCFKKYQKKMLNGENITHG